MFAQRYDAYEQDAFTAGISRRWTFFNCSTCEMTLEIAGAEHYYILEGECTVEHEGKRGHLKRMPFYCCDLSKQGPGYVQMYAALAFLDKI